jgi:hypothetical protein
MFTRIGRHFTEQHIKHIEHLFQPSGIQYSEKKLVSKMNEITLHIPEKSATLYDCCYKHT